MSNNLYQFTVTSRDYDAMIKLQKHMDSYHSEDFNMDISMVKSIPEPMKIDPCKCLICGNEMDKSYSIFSENLPNHLSGILSTEGGQLLFKVPLKADEVNHIFYQAIKNRGEMK